MRGWGMGWAWWGWAELRPRFVVLRDRWRDVKNKAFFHAKHRTYVDLKVSLLHPPTPQPQILPRFCPDSAQILPRFGGMLIVKRGCVAGQVEDFGAYSADCPPSEEGGACTPRPLRKGDQGSCLLDSPAPGAAGREGWDMRGGEGQGQVHTAALVGSREWKGRRWEEVVEYNQCDGRWSDGVGIVVMVRMDYEARPCRDEGLIKGDVGSNGVYVECLFSRGNLLCSYDAGGDNMGLLFHE